MPGVSRGFWGTYLYACALFIVRTWQKVRSRRHVAKKHGSEEDQGVWGEEVFRFVFTCLLPSFAYNSRVKRTRYWGKLFTLGLMET